MKKGLIIFFVLLFIAIGLVAFWYFNKNQYSKDILKLEILGPDYIQAGDEVEYLVRFKNNGNIALQNLELSFEFPDNCVPEDGLPMRVTKKIDGDLYPGQEKNFYFKAYAFGEENDILEADAQLRYRPKNLQAFYQSKTSFTTTIKHVPLTFEFDMPLKVESGGEIEFSLNYFSNLDYVLKNLRVKIEYPEGFKFDSSDPQAIDNTDWNIMSLAKANGGRITIRGTLSGTEGEQKVFRAKLGIIKDDRFIPLKEANQSIEISEPSLYISQMINQSQSYIANPGDLLHYEIFFRNIGKNPIQKKFMLVKLDGSLFDLSSIKTERGEAGRGDNSIIWDWKNVPTLKFLDTDQEGKVEFWVKLKNEPAEQKKNQTIKDEISIGGAQKVFETKVNSALSLEQKVYFSDDVFGNAGPIPPRVGQKTTYTVLWQIRNSFNDLANVRVKSQLAPNVVPTGKIFPEDAKFTYDSKSKEIIWNIGDMPAFETTSTPATLAFQIALTPDKSQIGKIPVLIDKAEIIGEDKWTSEIIKDEAAAVDASLPDDSSISQGQGKVGS